MIFFHGYFLLKYMLAIAGCYTYMYNHIHENSVGLSSTTNPKPKGQPSISLPAQANLTQQKAEPLRCLALRTRGGRLPRSVCMCVCGGGGGGGGGTRFKSQVFLLCMALVVIHCGAFFPA